MVAEFTAKTTYKTNRSGPARFILSHVRRHPVVAILLVLGAAGNAALAATVPKYLGGAFNVMIDSLDGGMQVVDDPGLAFLDALKHPKFPVAGLEYVALMGFAIIVTQVIRGFVQLARNFSAATFAQRIERDVRDELYASLLGKSMKYHDMIAVGEIMARVTNDVRELNLMMYPGINLLIGSGMFLLAPVIVSPTIHPQFLYIPLAFVIIHLIIQFRFIRSVHPVAQGVRSSFGRMNAHLAETLDGLEVVKGTAQEKYESGKFNTHADTVRDHFIHQGRIEARYLSYLLLTLGVVSGFIHAVILYQAGEILIGDIIAFTTMLSLFGFPVFTSLMSLSRMALGYASAERILNIITSEVDLDRNPNGHREPVKGAIRFEDVCFGYEEDRGLTVLEDISFDIRPGKTIALVGQTGSGKSSVTKLINRIYDATCGRVLIDGVDVRNWDLAALRSQISIIEQDIFLFSRTIAENIAFGAQDATQEQIEEVAKKAQAHDFIMSFPEGYETVIGQRGATLSGGQRQRVALARAFLTNPPILILDDSTSAIDSATEDKIQKAIWSASQGRTTILITHRLSQIRWADHIIVLRKGTVVAQGTHDNLLETSESYRRIFAQYDTPESSQIGESDASA
jgi:ATP-binding cassette, subfamily B, bacterial